MKLGCLRSCSTWVVVGLTGVSVAYAGFRWGDRVFPTLERWAGSDGAVEVGPVPSPGLAEATLDRFEDFRDGRLPEGRLLLGGAELTSVIRYSLPGLLPPGVDEPLVDFQDQSMLLSARVAVSAFPDLPALDEVLGLLPDTVMIEMRASLFQLGADHAALHVERVEASRIPLPGRMVPGILEALGRADRPGLPRDAMALPLPDGVDSAFVQDGHLVLVAEG